MTEKILIVEDEFVVANDLQMILEKAGYQIAGMAGSVSQAMAVIETVKPDLVLLDIYLKGKLTGIDLATILLKLHIPFIYISANVNEKVLEAAKATQPYGFLVKPYRDTDVLLSIDIARYRYQHGVNFKISSALYIEGFIENLGRLEMGREQKLLQVSAALQPYIPFDFAAMLRLKGDHQGCYETSILRVRFNEYEVVTFNDFLKLTGLSVAGYEEIRQLPADLFKDAVYTGNDFREALQQSALKNVVAETFGLQSNLVKAIPLANGEVMVLSFYSRLPTVYKQQHLDLLTYLTKTLSVNLEGLNAEEPTVRSLKPREQSVAASYRGESETSFPGIIGSGTALLNILDQIKIVAPTDTSVLVTGESGTGKEVVVKNLHLFSARNKRPLVTVNCAALPADLIESILFGHEKGSFTGASELHIGKFEEANGGTVFLDEIGEMPFELQSRLLRVLQEKEIERIGGRMPVPVNLRVIAATNRNLEKEIAAGRFRLDLYYRLNIFPIHLPPLRQRKEDIIPLANHFVSIHAKKLGKNIKGISRNMLNDLLRYDWPGNIRELDHLMERSVLLSQDAIIDEQLLHFPDTLQDEGQQQSRQIKTIAENEREYITEILKRCAGKISGEGGAADLLGIPATTLNSKIKKLGIRRL